MTPTADTLMRLYKFGALMAYEVQWFDVATFCVKNDPWTFSEKKALRMFRQYKNAGLNAQIKIHEIKFDGAFND